MAADNQLTDKEIPMLGKFITTAATGLLIAVTAAAAARTTDWSTAQKISEVAGNSSALNTEYQDGCPILSPDGRSLFMASTRPDPDGVHDGLNIWVATRTSTDEGFGAPVILPAPINSDANDFCPTPLRGNRLLFVSNRAPTCGLGDIYLTRNNPALGWAEPRRLACSWDGGPNSTLDEQGPSLIEVGNGVEQLFFSRSASGTPGDIFVSQRPDGEGFGPAAAVSELNGSKADGSASNDIQPNVRKDGRELVFSSNRASGTGQDIYTATRASVDDPWSPPVNLGEAVNTTANETRPSLSWDGGTLLFGRAPGAPITADIWISTR